MSTPKRPMPPRSTLRLDQRILIGDVPYTSIDQAVNELLIFGYVNSDGAFIEVDEASEVPGGSAIVSMAQARFFGAKVG